MPKATQDLPEHKAKIPSCLDPQAPQAPKERSAPPEPMVSQVSRVRLDPQAPQAPKERSVPLDLPDCKAKQVPLDPLDRKAILVYQEHRVYKEKLALLVQLVI